MTTTEDRSGIYCRGCGQEMAWKDGDLVCPDPTCTDPFPKL